jgi:hypothetical protein
MNGELTLAEALDRIDGADHTPGCDAYRAHPHKGGSLPCSCYLDEARAIIRRALTPAPSGMREKIEKIVSEGWIGELSYAHGGGFYVVWENGKRIGPTHVNEEGAQAALNTLRTDAIISSLQGEEQPVAWQERIYGIDAKPGTWEPCEPPADPNNLRPSRIIEYRPLFAHPSPEQAGEVERLTRCLEIANANHEKFEREWYLACDRAEAAEQALSDLKAEQALDRAAMQAVVDASPMNAPIYRLSKRLSKGEGE